MTAGFSIHCTLCPRLAGHLEGVRREYPHYHARPVPSFGPEGARLLVVGLAPGMHGANRTGRPFTGDYAGILLYRTLHGLGFASAPEAVAADDGLELFDCRITNAVRCLPPQNKPVASEVNNCNPYLGSELAGLPDGAVVLALGGVAHRAILKAEGLKQSAHGFGHGAEHRLARRRVLLDSYHCSRYNTQTRRLTTAMFQEVLARARQLIDGG